MTTSANVVWAPDAWAARLASGNPVYPYEWAVHYHGGGVFKRVCRGHVRTSAAVPLVGIRRLRVTGPGVGVVDVAPPPGPVLGLVLRATIVGQLGAGAAACGVARWTFGFRDAAGVWGIILDPAGRLTHTRP